MTNNFKMNNQYSAKAKIEALRCNRNHQSQALRMALNELFSQMQFMEEMVPHLASWCDRVESDEAYSMLMDEFGLPAAHEVGNSRQDDLKVAMLKVLNRHIEETLERTLTERPRK